MDNMKGKEFKILNTIQNGIEVEHGKFYTFFIHSHTFYEMTLYDPFDGYITVNDADIPIRTKTLILIAPFEFHKGTHVSGDNGCYFKVAFPVEALFTSDAPETSMIVDDLDDGDVLVGLYNELGKAGNDIEHTKILINAALSIVKKRGRTISSATKSGKKKIGVEAIKIINEGIGSGVSLSSVAKALYITPQYLSSTFKKEVGMTFSDYLTALRLRRAKKMLDETTLSITEICQACGYGNFSHFLRSFKHEFGTSPTSYRKRKEKNTDETHT